MGEDNKKDTRISGKRAVSTCSLRSDKEQEKRELEGP